MNLILGLLFTAASILAFAQEEQKVDKSKWAYYGEEFYKNIAGKKSLEKTFLAPILNDYHSSTKGHFDKINPHCQENCYRHISVGYDQARKIMFGELDKRSDYSGDYVLDVYCGKKFYFDNINQVSSMHNEVNIEHTWPQSKFNGTFPKDQQKSDMHHLFLTDTLANSMRGNSPFGFVSNVDDRMGGEGCYHSKMGFVKESTVYTPPAPHRGNVARALFYFSSHYNLNISPNEEVVLRKWHEADPVDSAEIKRHEAIAKYQKVRNPFIDHPELVDRIKDF